MPKINSKLNPKLNKDLQLTWDEITPEEWAGLLQKAGRCSFQQDWAYGAILDQGKCETNRFTASDKGEVFAFGQVITRRFFGLFKFSLLLNGPVWINDVTDEQKQEIIKQVSRHFPLKYFSLFSFSPIEGYDAKLDLYQDGGFRQIITGGSTVIIDLTVSEDDLWKNLYGKTRTEIRKAEKADFEVIYGDHSHDHMDWLLAKEKKQQKEKKYQGLPVNLVKAYGESHSIYSVAEQSQGVLAAFAVEKGESSPMAGALFLCHGTCATYHIGWSGKKGRKAGALSLLLWQMIVKLKQNGLTSLDLGGINTEKGANIARFKLGFGGEIIQQKGTYM